MIVKLIKEKEILEGQLRDCGIQGGTCATIHDQCCFKGNPMGIGTVENQTYSDLGAGWNGTIMSVKVTPGCTFKAYRELTVSDKPWMECTTDMSFQNPKDFQILHWSCHCGSKYV